MGLIPAHQHRDSNTVCYYYISVFDLIRKAYYSIKYYADFCVNYMAIRMLYYSIKYHIVCYYMCGLHYYDLIRKP